MATHSNREVWIWILAGAIGFGAFLLLYDKAFPTPSDELSITHAEAYDLAEQYLREHGRTFEDYKNATIFIADSQVAVYLERRLGMAEANAVIRDQELPVWGWAVRWFQSGEVGETQAWISPEGEFWGFEETLAEDAAGAKLDEDEARQIAEGFLRKAGESVPELELVDASTETLDNRTDHTFEWKRRNFDLGELQYRVKVKVQGDTIGTWEPYIHVPEAFERWYKDIQSRGMLIALVSLLLTVILFGLALVVFVQRYKAGDLRWRFALTFAVVIVVIGVLSQANSLPLLKASYDTAISYEIFVASVMFGMLMLLALYGAFILLTGASGEALTRERKPERVQPLHDLIAGRVLTPRFAAAAGRGYLAAMVILGYLAVFYVVGQRFLGVWTEPAGPASNIFNTTLPFLLPLFIGLMAAISEEFTYRLFAVSLIQKYLKRTALALLIPAIIWAFAHSSYPVFPIYVRGIELTIAGLFFGWLFLRYDIMTCIIAHYALDAFLISMPLLTAENTWFQASGLGVVLLGALPIIPAAIVWVRGRSGEARSGP